VSRIKPYYKVQITDLEAVERALDAVEKSLGSVSSVELLQGQLVEATFGAAGIKRIQHKLGRAPVGWFVVGKDAFVDFIDHQRLEPKPNLLLALESSGAVKVKLWIF